MTNEINIPPEEQIEFRRNEEKKALKSCFGRCGWASFTLVCAVLAISIVIGIMLFTFIPKEVYQKYMLLFNEVLMALATLCGVAVLRGMPKSAPEQKGVSIKDFLSLLCICAAISTVGSIISNYLIGFWNIFTGNNVSDPVTDLLTSIDLWQLLLCTGVLAPLLEELFFRKLLIDRMRRFGDTGAILVSSLLFALFHQNLSQFFYTFGLGVILAYLYCRTGKYSVVTMMHMAFNCIFGVLPAVLSMEVMPFLEALESLSEAELIEALPGLLGESLVPIVLFILYLLLRNAMTIIGIVLFVLRVKKTNISKPESVLSGKEQAKAMLLNAGMIAAMVINVLFIISSLFSS